MQRELPDSYSPLLDTLCNCCGIPKKRTDTIEYRYADLKFRFCSEECFAYYAGELLEMIDRDKNSLN